MSIHRKYCHGNMSHWCGFNKNSSYLVNKLIHIFIIAISSANLYCWNNESNNNHDNSDPFFLSLFSSKNDVTFCVKLFCVPYNAVSNAFTYGK